MADSKIDRISSEVHSPGFEIEPGLLAELLLDAIGPLLFEREISPCPGSQNSRCAGDRTPHT